MKQLVLHNLDLLGKTTAGIGDLLIMDTNHLLNGMILHDLDLHVGCLEKNNSGISDISPKSGENIH